MDPAMRIGPADADIVMLNKGGRGMRLARLARDEEAPREFLYGFLDLEKVGLSAAMMSSSTQAPGLIGALSGRLERGFAALTNLGVRPLSTQLAARLMGKPKVLISYTDGCSLSLGLGYPRKRLRPVLIGGFHGLSDIEPRVPDWAQASAKSLISRALAGLDHVFFFGPADRDFAIRRYGLAAGKSQVIKFGVDTDFWHPQAEHAERPFVVAVGQDNNRDYDLLAAAPVDCEVRIVTRRSVAVPPGASHVKMTVGDYFGSEAITDKDLRRLYNLAKAVIVPLKDVYQPSGYSVTLQAMSCGRPVVISRIRGLWSDLLKDGENCLMVPPGDATQLGAAIRRISGDPGFAAKLGRAARATALAHFGLEAARDSTLVLARLGLEMWRQRQGEGAP